MPRTWSSFLTGWPHLLPRATAEAQEAWLNRPEAGRCLDALRRLRDFPVTTEVLVSTQVRSGFCGPG